MKVKKPEVKKPEGFYILAYLLVIIIKIWKFWVIFIMKYPLHMSKSYFSGSHLAKTFPKKTLLLGHCLT
jgi:hypothetical protein